MEGKRIGLARNLQDHAENARISQRSRRPRVRQSHERDRDVPAWLALEPLPEVDGDRIVTNAGQRYGTSRGRTADLIRAAMTEAGMSQAEVARAVKIKEANLSLILSGQMLPSMRTAAELAALFDRPIEKLVDLNEVRVRGEEARTTRSKSGAATRRANPPTKSR